VLLLIWRTSGLYLVKVFYGLLRSVCWNANGTCGVSRSVVAVKALMNGFCCCLAGVEMRHWMPTDMCANRDNERLGVCGEAQIDVLIGTLFAGGGGDRRGRGGAIVDIHSTRPRVIDHNARIRSPTKSDA
jgi:hypothetical protein